MSCGHTMLTARSKRGVEFPVVLVLASSPRPSSPLSDKSTFELSLLKLLIEVRKTDVTCSAQQQQKKILDLLVLTTCGHVSYCGSRLCRRQPKKTWSRSQGNWSQWEDRGGWTARPQIIQRGWTTKEYTLLRLVCVCVCVCVSEQICAGCPRLMSPQLTPS